MTPHPPAGTPSDTPETDKQCDKPFVRWFESWSQMLEHARTLERQRDSALAELARVRAIPIATHSTNQALHAITCIHHTDAERAALPLAGNCPICAARERDQLRADLAAAHARLKAIYDATGGYADGAPDATAHDKLCNEISALAKL